MALQNALNRLRNNEQQLQNSVQYHRRSNTDKPEQVAQVNKVFTVEEKEKDIFDIDDDIFISDVDLFSSLAGGDQESVRGPLISEKSPPEPSTNHATSTHHSLPTAASQPPTCTSNRSPTTNEASSAVIGTSRDVHVCRPVRIHSDFSSVTSLERLKSFTFTKQPSQSRKGRSEGKRHSSFEPPAKKISLSTSCDTEDSLTSHTITEEGILSQDFISNSNNLSRPAHPHPHSNTATTSSSSQTNSDTIFKRPTSHPRDSTSFPFNETAKSLTPSLTVSSATTNSTPQRASLTASPALHTTPYTQAPPFSQGKNRSLSSHSSTRFSSSSCTATPLPPSPFSTPQHITTTTHVRRKFPGPAGVLPTLVAGQNLDSIVVSTPSLPTPSSTPRVKTLLKTSSKFNTTSSHSHIQGDSGNGDPSDFSQGPWIAMLQDLDMDDVYSAPLLKCTIARAIKQASQQKLKNGKVTHLRVLLQSIVPACRNTSAVLRDPTGEILCTIHQSVMEEHRQELQPGAVIVLRQVTVFSPAPRKHYLSITPDNIVTIYPSPTSTTSATTARRTICLTAVEKRFREQATTNENSPQYLPHTHSTPQPPHTATRAPVDNTEHRMSSSQCSTEGAPVHIQDHRNSCNTQQSHSHQTTDSVFSNQLCEDEFDSIMGDFCSELDF